MSFSLETCRTKTKDYRSCNGSDTNCIPEHQICSGFEECENGNDELDCGRQYTILFYKFSAPFAYVLSDYVYCIRLFMVCWDNFNELS